MPRRWSNANRGARANMWPLAKELHERWETARKPIRPPRGYHPHNRKDNR